MKKNYNTMVVVDQTLLIKRRKFKAGNKLKPDPKPRSVEPAQVGSPMQKQCSECERQSCVRALP